MRSLTTAAVLVLAAACSKKAETSKQDPPAPAPSPSTGGEVAPTPTPNPTPSNPTTTAPKETAVTLPAPGTPPPATPMPADFASIWETPLKTLKGDPTTLAAFKGKAVLVVNVASQCGLTPQYAALEAVQEKYKDKGFTVVGFPCNQFGGQEPGTAEEIATFCSSQYGVTFPIMEKIEVNGDGKNPVYAKLTTIADASAYTGPIRWNFEKFLISADGTKITRFAPKTTPNDPTVIGAIEAALPTKL